MIHLLKQEALSRNNALKIVSVNRLHELKSDIEHFKIENQLNNFQKWIVNDLYSFEVPKADFDIQSIVIIAIPHPAYAKVAFIRNGKCYYFPSPIMSDFGNTDRYLNHFMAKHGLHTRPAFKLPLKRLAARSGLSVYGRNNITYVDGMGSFFSYLACYTDLPCDEDDWTDMKQADMCTDCTLCLTSCPTKAIGHDRFLIDNTKCLSFLNESPEELPDWVPVSAHHSVYDCLKCQLKCPMNHAYANNVDTTITFDETETALLLESGDSDSFPSALKQKVMILGMDQWIRAIPRNLELLFEQSDSNRENAIH